MVFGPHSQAPFAQASQSVAFNFSMGISLLHGLDGPSSTAIQARKDTWIPPRSHHRILLPKHWITATKMLSLSSTCKREIDHQPLEEHFATAKVLYIIYYQIRSPSLILHSRAIARSHPCILLRNVLFYSGSSRQSLTTASSQILNFLLLGLGLG